MFFTKAKISKNSETANKICGVFLLNVFFQFNRTLFLHIHNATGQIGCFPPTTFDYTWIFILFVYPLPWIPSSSSTVPIFRTCHSKPFHHHFASNPAAVSEARCTTSGLLPGWYPPKLNGIYDSYKTFCSRKIQIGAHTPSGLKSRLYLAGGRWAVCGAQVWRRGGVYKPTPHDPCTDTRHNAIQ